MKTLLFPSKKRGRPRLLYDFQKALELTSTNLSLGKISKQVGASKTRLFFDFKPFKKTIEKLKKMSSDKRPNYIKSLLDYMRRRNVLLPGESLPSKKNERNNDTTANEKTN